MDISSSPTRADILIVDDIPDNIRFLSSFLLEQGYTVRKAINGQMALTAIAALPPDLILLDVNMPDIGGYEICRRLKADTVTQPIPIIFLSAGSEAIDKVKAFQLGGVDYITKPFHLEEVLVRIQTQLTIQQLQKELKAQNEQLRQTLEELKTAQENLVQQEKMATLRKVVAGVAHEINNPLSFIACNIKPAEEYIQNLVTLLELYQQKYPDPDPEIQTLIEDIDLEFLVSDLVRIIHSMGNGAERIRTVILALRIFTRLDESGIKKINFHESLDSILAILKHRLNDANQNIIQVQCNYGNLPPITCYADQCNQVFFNLLCNAIDAIEEKQKRGGYKGQKPEILIQTWLEQDKVYVKIQDNGSGISVANQPLIFEPFFTTKTAGQGVGLGLATSRRIIEELHRGRLTYRSQEGEGTEFIIQIPCTELI